MACALALAAAGAAAAAPARAPAPAPEAPPAARPVSLAQAIAAVGGAPEHVVAQADRNAAVAEVAAAGAWPGTTISVSTSAKTAHLGIIAAIPLPIFGTLGANRAVAEAEASVA